MNGDSLEEIICTAYDYQIELIEESDRGAAILAAANFEEWLRSIILGYFAKLNYKLKSKLFENGALSTFSAKIDFGFALGIYDKDTLNELHVIKDIRNEFAHSTKPMGFENASILGMCQKLNKGDASNSDNPRTKYLKYLEQVRETVMADRWSGKAERRRKRENGT